MTKYFAPKTVAGKVGRQAGVSEHMSDTPVAGIRDARNGPDRRIATQFGAALFGVDPQEAGRYMDAREAALGRGTEAPSIDKGAVRSGLESSSASPVPGYESATTGIGSTATGSGYGRSSSSDSGLGPVASPTAAPGGRSISRAASGPSISGV